MGEGVPEEGASSLPLPGGSGEMGPGCLSEAATVSSQPSGVRVGEGKAPERRRPKTVPLSSSKKLLQGLKELSGEVRALNTHLLEAEKAREARETRRFEQLMTILDRLGGGGGAGGQGARVEDTHAA